ncbi:MAG: tetratricopeptide repeat protein, partial [Spirochaetia bacterium]|nr:tetratricopeptide repeat protein [Spirochaetia bacterium]
MIKKNKFLSFFILILFSFSLAAEDSSKSASDYFVLAEKEIEEENWYSAYQYLLETVTKNPDYQKAWFLLAECSYQLDEFALTLSYLENAEKYFPSDSKILNLRGMTYISLGKTLEAEKIFDEVLKIYPNDVTARFGRAELFLLNGKYTAAEKEYENALFREISNRKALLSLALLLGKQGKYKEAQEYIQKALNFYTGNADVYYYSAILYVMQGDYKNAEKRVRLSLELNPAEDKFYELLANILYRLSQYEEVINICD